jgi:hypothetical protein
MLSNLCRQRHALKMRTCLCVVITSFPRTAHDWDVLCYRDSFRPLVATLRSRHLWSPFKPSNRLQFWILNGKHPKHLPGCGNRAYFCDCCPARFVLCACSNWSLLHAECLAVFDAGRINSVAVNTGLGKQRPMASSTCIRCSLGKHPRPSLRACRFYPPSPHLPRGSLRQSRCRWIGVIDYRQGMHAS